MREGERERGGGSRPGARYLFFLSLSLCLALPSVRAARRPSPPPCSRGKSSEKRRPEPSIWGDASFHSLSLTLDTPSSFSQLFLSFFFSAHTFFPLSLPCPLPPPTHFQTLFRDSPDVKEFLTNPCVTAQKKKDLLKRLGAEAGLDPSTLNFLGLLVDNDRLVAADEVFVAFEKLYCGLTDTQVAVVRSAVKLEQEQQFLIAKKLQELTGSKNIKLKPEVDESLIAGFVVEYGSSQVDLSVKGQLDKITNELTTAQV